VKPTIVVVGGFTSNSGKTTLMCELLGALRGWEAIKVSRGHYRSCGKDPHACCISPLLGDAPVVRTGREETYAPSKDTGRYWDAGATNVHWAIVTNRQVEEGVRMALSRVKSKGVLIEGNSPLRFVEADYSVIVARADALQIKPSARRALGKASAIYLSAVGVGDVAQMSFEELRRRAGLDETIAPLPVYTRESLSQLIAQIDASGHPPFVQDNNDSATAASGL
jgi:molybdopterin-guanine dinucleotide biosynthesis protein